MGNEVKILMYPQRIISLVPSQTEFLFDLGLGDRIVGLTKFCLHPNHARKSKTIIGGTKNFRFDVIDSLNPDLIVGNKEENYKDGIDKLSQKYPVWISDIKTLSDAYEMMKGIGSITGRENRALEIINEIKKQFKSDITNKKKAIYLIWNNPIMSAGKDTFIHSMMENAGFTNCVLKNRYPIITEEEIEELKPEVILLSSEPYPFKEKHLQDFKKRFPEAKIQLVDGELFSWYGSRLLKASGYFSLLCLLTHQ